MTTTQSVGDNGVIETFVALEEAMPVIAKPKKGKTKPIPVEELSALLTAGEKAALKNLVNGASAKAKAQKRAAKKRQQKKELKRKVTPKLLPSSHLTGYYHTPGKWTKHSIPIDDGVTTSVRFETDTGAFIYMRVRYDPDRQEAVYSVSNQASEVRRWNKNPIAAGVIGKEPVFNYNKAAQSRIKDLTKALYGILAVTDCMTADGYYQDGKRKTEWDVEKATPITSQYVNMWEKSGVIVKGIPVHCQCGKHKTKDGLYTCKDLHDRLAAAKMLISL